MIFLIFSLGFIGLFFMPLNFNHNEIKLPTYFSGLHKSSYIFSISLLLLLCMYRDLRTTSKYFFIPFIIFALYMLFVGWEIRTSILIVVAFFAYWFLFKQKNKIKTVLLPFLFALMFALLLLLHDSIAWNEISSGRINMWNLKLEMLMNADIMQAIFGRGFGSDHVEVSGWYGEKNSHNSFLQTVTEFGLIGLVLLLATIYSIYNEQASLLGKSAVFSYVFSGLVSNGVIYRLLPGYIFACLIVFLYVQEQHYSNKRKLIETK
ncbi:MAG: hypothetical protein GKR93_08535 [Gammaproteobacteria bacterium]|nr:hypothetical protein [Gammaproteobacteria bacterium]